MTTLATFPAQAENWLDERGKGAWIAAMVLGFVLFWPVGLALLFYMIFVKRSFACGRNGAGRRGGGRWEQARVAPPSGNSAFDAYREDTLRRLEEEQAQFERFLARLRQAKDKAEFDQFMEERSRAAGVRDHGDDAHDGSLDDGSLDDGAPAARDAAHENHAGRSPAPPSAPGGDVSPAPAPTPTPASGPAPDKAAGPKGRKRR